MKGIGGSKGGGRERGREGEEKRGRERQREREGRTIGGRTVDCELTFYALYNEIHLPAEMHGVLHYPCNTTFFTTHFDPAI